MEWPVAKVKVGTGGPLDLLGFFTLGVLAAKTNFSKGDGLNFCLLWGGSGQGKFWEPGAFLAKVNDVGSSLFAKENMGSDLFVACLGASLTIDSCKFEGLAIVLRF